MNLIPTISAEAYTTSAFIIGLLLCDNLTPAEQNSLGNWFMEVGQVLCTVSAQQQLLNNRTNISNSYNSHVVNDNNLQKYANSIKKEVNNIFTSLK